MLYFSTGTVISKPSVWATDNDNKSEFLLLRTLIFRKQRTENVMKRYDFIYVVFKMFVTVFECSANFVNLVDRSSY